MEKCYEAENFITAEECNMKKYSKPMHVAYQIKGSYKTNVILPILCQIIASTT